MQKSFLTPALAIALMVSASVTWSDEILVKGSDTLLNLVQQLSEAYMKDHPDTTISIVGGGSGVGIAALIDRNTDIANSSRDIKPEEVEKAKGKGVDPVEITIAIDGMSVIVSSKNPISNLTVEQLGAIYRGEITNWKDVGGPKMSINLYGRQPSSGTYVFFMEHVLKGDYSPKMRQMAGNAQIVDAIKQDKSGIGYVGLGYIKESKDIKVVSVGKRVEGKPVEYVSPLIFLTPLKPGQKPPEPKDYPLTRALYQYTNGTPTGAVRDFIKFELGDKGQGIVESVGFLKLPEEGRKKNLKLLEKA